MVKSFRCRIIAFFLCGFLCGQTSFAALPELPARIVTPRQASWSELSIPQKMVLAPLADDWDSLESHQQKKWLNVAEGFPKLSGMEQRRAQTQMHAWNKFSPEERALARDNFEKTKALPRAKRDALKEKWEAYLRLSPEEKEKFLRADKTPEASIKPAANAVEKPVENSAEKPSAE